MSESINFLNAILYGNEDACHYAVHLYEKAEKYKRHDLRKNPEDLPEQYKPVLLKTLRSGYVVAYIDINGDWFVDYNDEFCYCEKGSPYAVAWREIEPFEEEK